MYVCMLTSIMYTSNDILYVQTHSTKEGCVVKIELYDFHYHRVTCYKFVYFSIPNYCNSSVLSVFIQYMTKLNICSGCGFIRLRLSGKLSKLLFSFLLCKHVTYRRTCCQSMDDFHVPCRKFIFGKNTIKIRL